MRLERVALYVVSSLLVALSGLLVLVTFQASDIGVSIGTSLIAGGLASIAFAVIRYLDDRASDTTAHSFQQALADLRDNLGHQYEAVNSLRRLAGSLAGQRSRVYDRHPQDEVSDELARSSDELVVEVMGLTLRPFCRDQLATLEARGRCRLRLLTQDPRGSMFEQVCHQESRDLLTMREDVLWVTERAQQLAEASASGLSVELRWIRDFPTITMTRVNDVLYVRPRFLREATQPRVFHERYAVEEGLPFTAYTGHFQTAWDSAFSPTTNDIAAARGATPPGQASAG